MVLEYNQNYSVLLHVNVLLILLHYEHECRTNIMKYTIVHIMCVYIYDYQIFEMCTNYAVKNNFSIDGNTIYKTSMLYVIY